MKILFVTRGFPSKENPMAGNYEAVQAKAIAAKGHDVSVISIYRKPFWRLFQWAKTSHRTVDGVDVYEGEFPSVRFHFIGRISKHLRKFAYQKAFMRCTKEQGMPDIVHAHIISTASIAIFYREDYHLPFVITEHWTMVNKPNPPQWLKRMAPAYSKADRVICVSQVLADSLKQNFHVDSVVINNMVSNTFFQSSRVNRNDGMFRFVACGAFRENRNKGFDILVDAFALGRFSPNVSLDIVGDGPDLPNIKRKIEQYGLSAQVRLLGVKQPEEVSSLLCNSDCFVLSSRLETFAIVVIEAMAKGLPVVATRCGGPETFLKPEHGLLVDKENPKQLAEAMKHMVDHSTEYNPESIRNYCYEHFSQDVIAEQIIDVYKEVLNSKHLA